MDHRHYIHDPDRVKSYLREVSGGRVATDEGQSTEVNNARLVAAKPVKIVIPARFAERELAYVGIDTRIVGIFAMIVDDQYYGVSLANAMMRITPSSTSKVMYDEDEYYEFSFDAGATVCPQLDLVKIDTLVYNIYDEIISKGRVPWYLSYEQLGMLFDTAKEHAGANIGQQQEVTELMVSIIARDAEDRTKYYRQVIAQDPQKKPVFIPLRSVAYAATNTLNKLAGSYAKDGMISALVTPTERVERLEELLRR
jgi:hypothetical protein